MSEDMLTTTDVTGRLYSLGIRASRDRVARMADLLFPRPEAESGRHRRFDEEQLPLLAEAFRLQDDGFALIDIAAMVTDPEAAAEKLRAETEKRIARLRSLSHQRRVHQVAV